MPGSTAAGSLRNDASVTFELAPSESPSAATAWDPLVGSALKSLRAKTAVASAAFDRHHEFDEVAAVDVEIRVDAVFWLGLPPRKGAREIQKIGQNIAHSNGVDRRR